MAARSFVVGFAAFALLAVAACGEPESSTAAVTAAARVSAAPAETPIATDLNEAESSYLDDLDEILRQEEARLMAAFQELGGSSIARSPLADIFEGVNFSTLSTTRLATLERLEAPERFQSDHRLVVELLTENAERAPDLDQAIQDNDLAAFMLTLAERNAGALRLTPETSAPVCTILGRANRTPPSALALICSPEQLPGGAYGDEMRALLLRDDAVLRPRLTAFSPALTAQETFTILATIQPVVEATLEDELAALRAIEPPAEFRADHVRAIQYGEEILEVARSITTGTEEGKLQKILTDFYGSQRVYCSAVEDFSEAARSIFGVRFAPEICGQFAA